MTRERKHTNERLNREWNELYQLMKAALSQYGQNDIDGGDYFLVDEIFSSYIHQVEVHKLHMLRPEIVGSLQSLLKDYPDWEIEISIFVPQGNISIDPGDGLTLRDDGIVDALDRTLLPEQYRHFRYDGSLPPKGPKDLGL